MRAGAVLPVLTGGGAVSAGGVDFEQAARRATAAITPTTLIFIRIRSLFLGACNLDALNA